MFYCWNWVSLCFLGYFQKITLVNLQEFQRKNMAQFLHGKTGVCLFVVKVETLQKENLAKDIAL